MSYQFSERLVEGVARAQSRFAGAEAVLGGEKFCQRAVDLVSDDFFVGHEDVLEDRLIELAPYLVTSAHVEGVWIFEQSKVGLEELGSLAEVVDHRVEISAELFALSSDVGETSTDLALRQCAVCGEVEQVLFLGVEVDQLILKLLAKEPLRGLGV
ncbi:hypothetical protein [Glaciihabitans sp. UYNi722]|uniref:hypothetical protein n=1 Tax=Glaciihabitans sp. UYNi722 TaxID=3156344 RepID=UPI003398596B